MDLILHNTLGRKKEVFTPQTKGKVGIYQCGPTVYWTQHIGNMRAVYVADTIVRTFKLLGYDVTFVRNYTDVGHLQGDNAGDADTGQDRMEVASKREGLNPDEIASKYIAEYEKDISLLGTLPPTFSPKATLFVPEMIAMVSSLLEKGFAYTTPEAIYFDTTKVSDYTKLSLQKIHFQEANSGHGTVTKTSKKHPSDFALWFFKTGAHENALQVWRSPFESPLVANGLGFPGWHIECSAMSKRYLGETFDIHIGGVEHIPIHHTNEIAQSESANGAQYVQYWLHNEHLLVDGKKMAKSEGTSYVLSDIIERGYSPRVLRFFFLQAHYRSKQNFTWEGLEASKKALDKIDTHCLNIEDTGKLSFLYVEKFLSFLLDDFNTSGALAVVFDMLKDKELTKEDFLKTLVYFDQVLGLDFKTKREEEIIPDEISLLAEKRMYAKKNNDWELADKLRTEIQEKGFDILDTKEGYSIKKRS